MVRRFMMIGVIGAALAGGGCTSGGDPDAALPDLPGLCGVIGSERLRKLVPDMTIREVSPSVVPTRGNTPRERSARCDTEGSAALLSVVLEGSADVDADCPGIEGDDLDGGMGGASLIPADELAGLGDRRCGYVRDTDRQTLVSILARTGDKDLSVIYTGPTDDRAATRRAVIDFTAFVLARL